MGNFVVSARKYRPILFKNVVGQSHVTDTLKNAIKNNHLAHAFLFCGPRGVGKTTCARLLAKVLNCEQPTSQMEPCDVCSSCRSFSKNTSLNILELDAASNNSVEHIRHLTEQVRFAPRSGKYKIYIIDEVHMLSQAAFNAFLKTLEEPPPHAIFILATTEKHKIIPTILSRCQIFDFKRIGVMDIVAHLQKICTSEVITAEEEALNIIAQKAEGALRDALSIFDRIVSFSGQRIRYADVIENLNILDYDYYFRIVNTFLSEDLSALLVLFDEILSKGFEGDIFITGLAQHLRNLLVAQDSKTVQLLEVSGSVKERYMEQAQYTEPSLILSALSLANDCDVHYKLARNKRLHVEMTLIKMAYIRQALRLKQLPATYTTSTTDEKSSENSTRSHSKENIAKDEAIQYKANSSSGEREKAIPTKVKDRESQASSPKKEEERADSKKPLSIKGKRLKKKPLKDTLKERAEAEEKTLDEPVNLAWNLENIRQFWSDYASALEAPYTKALMQGCKLTALEEDKLSITVQEKRTKDIILKDGKLKSKMETTFQRKILDFDILIDIPQADLQAPKKKPLTGEEKYRYFLELSSSLEELQKRLDLVFGELHLHTL